MELPGRAEGLSHPAMRPQGTYSTGGGDWRRLLNLASCTRPTISAQAGAFASFDFDCQKMDPLLVKYGDLDARYRHDPESLQRLVEGQHVDSASSCCGMTCRWRGKRNKIHTQRQEVLDGTAACGSERERQITLRVIDDLLGGYDTAWPKLLVLLPGLQLLLVRLLE